MLRTSAIAAFVCVFFASLQAAFATVQVHVDIATQTMSVESSNGSYSWPVSTGRAGFNTPQGTYHPQRLLAVAFSAKYHNSPMPHSIFFRGGYAIHGTYETGHLGSAVSHGCVRLAPGNAATLFSLVKAEGAVITIGGGGGAPVFAGHHRSAGAPKYASRHHHRGDATRVASRGHHRNIQTAAYHPQAHEGYLAYTSQGEPAPVRQWLANPTSGY